MTITNDLRKAVNRRRPTLSTFPGIDTLTTLASRPIRPRRALATPPPGSGLQPVLGDPGAPLLGSTLDMLHDTNAFGLQRLRTYGPVTWTEVLGGVKLVIAAGGDATQVVLSNKDNAYSQSGWEFFIGPFFNRGLMLLNFEEHHRHRRIMQQAFTRPRLIGYLATMNDLIDERVQSWPADGQQFELFPAIKALSMDVATVLFMSGAVGTTTAVLSAFEDAVHAGTAVLRFPVPGLSWSRGLAGRRALETYFRAKLPSKRASDDTDVFAALCHAESEEGNTFSDDDIVNHMIFLMMAAHDTTTTTATAVAYYLAKHPQWQERVRAECAAIADEPLDINSLGRMPALDLVINESLRLTSSVPALVRRTVTDTDILGHFIPADTIVTVLPGINHRMSEHWTDPDTFDPERFAEPRREDKSHRFAYVPFGGGAHKCIGMVFGNLEVKTIIFALLTRYRLELPSTGYEIEWDKSALWFPTDGLPMTLHPLG